MLLFVYNRSQEIFGNAQDTFLFTVEKKQTQVSTFVTMEEMIDSFCETNNQVATIQSKAAVNLTPS